MKTLRWDLIAASLIIGGSLIVGAFIAAPNRYVIISHGESAYVRMDRKSGEMISCGYVERMVMRCRNVAVTTTEEAELEQIGSDIANELGD